MTGVLTRITLLLGCLFLYFAVRSFRRRQDWRGAARLTAQITDVQ